MELVIKTSGMVCGGCENRVQNALKLVDGVENVVADHNTGDVKVTLSKEVDKAVLEEKIEDLGFTVVR